MHSQHFFHQNSKASYVYMQKANFYIRQHLYEHELNYLLHTTNLHKIKLLLDYLETSQQ